MQPGHVPFAGAQFQSWDHVSQQLFCRPDFGSAAMFSSSVSSEDSSPPSGHELSPSKVLKGSKSPPSSMTASAPAAEKDTATQLHVMLKAAACLSNDDSSDSDDLCGPHQHCCGGALHNGVYTECERRLGKRGGFQHSRGQVCLSQHKYFQCATCKEVVHSGCWVPTATGSYLLPSGLTPFHCYSCACKKHQLPSVAQEQITQTTATKESTARNFMSESDLRKHLKACNWKVSHGRDNSLHYHCAVGTCKVKFNAKKNPDDTWSIFNQPPCHSCGAPAPPQLTSLITLKDNLTEDLVAEIERLGVSKAFRSKQIQNHLLQQEQVLVDTKLIGNIVYRARQKLFGHEGDMIHLLEQQKVAFVCLCTQVFIAAHACHWVTALGACVHKHIPIHECCC